MKKLSQRELIEEGFGSLLGDIAKRAAKAVVKTVSPTAYGIAANAGKVVSKHFQGSDKPTTPKDFIKSWQSSFPESISDVRNIQINNEGTKKHPLYIASVELQLRDPSTHKPTSIWIPLQNLAIKQVSNKKGDDIVYQLAAGSVDDVFAKAISDNPESVAAIEELGNKLNSTVIDDVLDDDTVDSSEHEKLDTARTRMNRQLDDFKRSDLATESKKSQKSLLKHLQSWSS